MMSEEKPDLPSRVLSHNLLPGGRHRDPDLPQDLPQEWVKKVEVPDEERKLLQPEVSEKKAPCGLRLTALGPGKTLVDTFCWRPNCLKNGGKCTGIRFVPDPTIPYGVLSLAQQTEVALGVRRTVKKKLRNAAPNHYLVPSSVMSDIREVRSGFRKAMKLPGHWTP